MERQEKDGEPQPGAALRAALTLGMKGEAPLGQGCLSVRPSRTEGPTGCSAVPCVGRTRFCTIRQPPPGPAPTPLTAALHAGGGGQRPQAEPSPRRRSSAVTPPLLPAAWSTTFGSRRAASSGC